MSTDSLDSISRYALILLVLIMGIFSFLLMISPLLCWLALRRIERLLWKPLDTIVVSDPESRTEKRREAAKCRFRVEGVDISTHQQATYIVKAASRAEAGEIAKRRLAEVTKVEPAPT